MGEARRRAQEGLMPIKAKRKKNNGKNDSSRILSWFPITEQQRIQFYDFTTKAAWVGIGVLVVIWLVVRIIGPAAGWWIPADVH